MTLGGDLFPLGGKQLRNWLSSSGQGLFREFDTGASMLDWLRSEGASIRTADFYAIRRTVLEQFANVERFAEYDMQELVPAAWHTDDHGWNLSTDFLYYVRVDGVNPDTLDDVTKYLAVGSNRQLSQSEIYDTLGGMVSGEAEAYGIIAETYTLEKALVMPGVYV